MNWIVVLLFYLPLLHGDTSPCQMGFVLYMSESQTPIATYQTEYEILDLAQFDISVINFTLFVEFCEVAIQSAVTNVSIIGGQNQTSPSNKVSFVVGRNFSVPSAFLKVPKTYNITAVGYSRRNGRGFPIRKIDIQLIVLPAFQVTGLTLVNAITNKDIPNFFDSLALSNYPTILALTLRAETAGRVASVEFNLVGGGAFGNSTNYTFVDTKIPFCLGGNTIFGTYAPVQQLLAPGDYTITATPYSRPRKKKPAGLVYALFFEVLARFRVQGFTLIDAATGKAIRFSGLIDLLRVTSEITFRANTVGSSGSIYFVLSRQNQDSTYTQVFSYTDNAAPYALGGDNPNGDFLPVAALTVAGIYKLQAFAYSGVNLQGEQSPPREIVFSISPPFQITGFTLVDAASGRDLQSFRRQDYLDIELSQYNDNATFTMRANTVGSPVRSVMFTFALDKDPNVIPISATVDNVAPFSLDGSSGRYQAFRSLIIPGDYVLSATPYALVNAQGDKGRTFTTHFRILPRQYIRSLTLVNAFTEKDVSSFDSRTKIDLSRFSSADQFTVRVNVGGTVGSVEFKLYRYKSVGGRPLLQFTHVSNEAPFALGGLTPTGHYQSVSNLRVEGRYQLSVALFAGPNKKGDLDWGTAVDFVVQPRVSIPNITLVDSTTNSDVFFLAYSTITVVAIVLANFAPGTLFNLRANPLGPVHSVELSWTKLNARTKKYDVVRTVVANAAPFTLGPSSGLAALSIPGIYRLLGTPFSGKNKTGIRGKTIKQDINVVIDVAGDTCAGFCGGAYNLYRTCGCDASCVVQFNCCADWCKECPDVSPSVCS